MEAESAVVVSADRRTVNEAAEALITHLEAVGRKPSTLNTYRSLHRGRARGLAEAFHVAELDVYRRLFDLIAIGRRRAATA